MAVRLYEHQLKAVQKMHNGCILNGGVGTGKSITALAYYHRLNGGDFGVDDAPSEGFVPMNDPPMDLYIITTANKRDSYEWDKEAARFLLSQDDKIMPYSSKFKIDSWNNIEKYEKVEGAFFIFDETRIRNWGTWSKIFVKIAKKNQWILLTATPGDCWSDYMPVFIANGFYRNPSEFRDRHIRYNPHVNYPSIQEYLGVKELIRYRDRLLVDMEMDRHTVPHHEYLYCDYDKQFYKDIMKNRWNYDENKPIESGSELCQQLRKCINTHEDRVVKIYEVFENHPKMIIFYNYNYELEELKAAFEFMAYDGVVESFAIAEWNGHAHQEIPDTDSWVYLVQYNAGAEGWNCIKTDTIVFYSQNYSWSIMEQACGRIDRLNTPFIDLYYYHLTSTASIDLAIERALKSKKKFNEGKFSRKC